MISFIVPTVHRSSTLARCVECIMTLTVPGDEVIIVHQGREMGEDLLLRESERIKVIPLAGMGLSKARNAGAHAAQNKLLVFIDDDIRLDNQFVASLKKYMERDVEAVCGRILIPGEGVPYARVQDDRAVLINGFIGRLKRCLGGIMAFRKAAFDDAGGFDEMFGIGAKYGGAEDIDIVLRLRHKGHKVLYGPALIGYHEREARDEPCEYLTKVYRYGRGEGAVLAKHWLGHGDRLMLINYLGLISKPMMGAAWALLRADFRQMRIYRRIIKGRLSGFSEYTKGRHDAR